MRRVIAFQLGGVYAWARVRSVPRDGTHLLIAQDEKEITVVTAPENLASLDAIEVNRDRWRMIAIDPTTPFYCVGFIATISARLAAEGLDILVVSTYSRDVFFVKDEETERAIEILT
jgi:hypothetical protein